MNNSVPVVVIKEQGGHGALAVARSLGRLGIPTYLVSQKADAVSTSRYWTNSFMWDFSAPREDSLEFLLDVGRQIGTRAILLAIPDSAALFIENNAAALAERFIFSKSSPGATRLLTNKWQMFLAAKEHGVPTPEAAYPKSREDVEKFLQTARFPIVLKGADQLLPQAKWKEIVHNATDLLEKFDHAADSGQANLILQEYIPGGDESVWMCNAYFGAGSECRAIFTGHKLRQTPPHAGIATLAICSPNKAVENATRQFMQAVGYQGLVGIGYRYDARDGLYKVLDVNPRVSAVFRLFRATNGMDVVRACYLDLTSQPVPASELSIGRKWMLEEDLFTSMSYAKEGNLTFAQWLKSMRGIQELHWFAADDLVPFFVWGWKRACALFDASVRHAKSSSRNAIAMWSRRPPVILSATEDSPS